MKTLKRILLRPFVSLLAGENSERRWDDQATPDDLYYCYRILLGRRPDEVGWKQWNLRLLTEHITVQMLAEYFCKSPEYVLKSLSRGVELVKLDGFELFVYGHDWDVGSGISRSKEYEPHISSFVRRRLKEGMTFVDVGANVGYFTMLAARLVGDRGRVVGVECNPNNCELIYRSLRRNRFENVLIYPFAVSDSRKLMRLYWGYSNGNVEELSEDARLDVPAGDDIKADDINYIVQAVTLDFILQNESRIDIIKMDIEGSEGKTWRGMRQTLERHRPGMIMEFAPRLLEANSKVKPEEFLDEVKKSGYSIFILQSNEGELAESVSAAEAISFWREKSAHSPAGEGAHLDLACLPVNEVDNR